MNKTNEILTVFAEERSKQTHERFCPRYHFISPYGLSNDPNGLCYWQGKWHLFYQDLPPNTMQNSWGHAVSDDLVHWKDLPLAITPDPETASFSGSVLIEENRAIAMYYGVGVGNIVAVSTDAELRNWEKLTGTAVIPAPQPYWIPTTGEEMCAGKKVPKDAINFIYDPCIWKQGDFYYSLSGGTMVDNPAQRSQRTAFLFRSPDLINWEYLHPFVENDLFGRPGDDCGCPYFWPLGDKHILLHFSHKGASHYIIGDYDTGRNKLIALSGGDFGFGPTHPGGLLAPSAYPDGQGGVITMFNIATGTYADGGWNNQVISLPRRLTLDGEELNISPVESLNTLRRERRSGFDGMELPANEEILLDGFSGNSIELETEIDPGDSRMIELNVLRSPGKEEYTAIRFYPEVGYRELKRPPAGKQYFEERIRSVVSIDSSHSTVNGDILPRYPETAQFLYQPGEPLKLRVFIDKSILEVFVNDKVCLTLRVYPDRPDSTGISLFSRGNSAKILKCNLWEMEDIYR